jgi:hypothetical protein
VDEVTTKGLAEGATWAAPTAPHATPRAAGGARTGPELFWARWPTRLALALAVVVSAAVHGSVFPFQVPHRFELNDVEGEAAIPVDVLEETTPAPPPAEPVEPSKRSDETPEDRGTQHGLTSPRRADAGASAEASAPDAANDAHEAALDGSVAAAEPDGGGSSGPRDPQAIVGAAGSVQADVVLVMLLVNAEVIRAHPLGATIGYLLRGVPQWNDFMSGTDIDPVRDTDWVMISGPSLINTMRDVVLLHYSAPAAAVERAIQVVSRKYAQGGPVDAGVPGVRATRVHADRAERVILRGQPQVLAVVPPNVVEKVARQLRMSRVPPHVRPGEAVYLRLVNPHHPMPEIPESIREMRLRVVPRPDEGADVFIEGDTPDAETAADAAEAVRRVVRRHNDMITSLVTHGLLDHVEVTSEGPLVKAHLVASRDQIQTLVLLVGEYLGVEPPPASGDEVPSRGAAAPFAPATPPVIRGKPRSHANDR